MARLAQVKPKEVGLLLVDLQNDFLHPNGAYGRAGLGTSDIAALPDRLAPVVSAARSAGVFVVSTHFTLVGGRNSKPLISDHLAQVRPFLGAGDFVSGSWGHDLVDGLGPTDAYVEKVAYSAFAHTRLEWLLRKVGVRHLVVAGIVTNGGVASTVRDAHVREFDVSVIEDGSAAFDPVIHAATITSLGSLVEITNCAAVERFFAASP
jgi:ureidoacrylate peracid hydrolase